MNIEKNVPLQSFNTLQLQLTAKYYVVVTSLEQIKEALNFAKEKNLSLLILGGGSNIVFSENFQGLLIHLQLKGINLHHADEQYYYVEAAAGENWHDFVTYCLDCGYYGLENLSLIPGTVGAAPIQNIGAYGVELQQFFKHLVAINIDTQEIINFNTKDCQFAYRDSIFKHKLQDQFIIIKVGFRLLRDEKLECSYPGVRQALQKQQGAVSAKKLSEIICTIRRDKLPDPTQLANVGSFFKNPLVDLQDYKKLSEQYPEMPGYENAIGKVKIPAAWLIESCGWKGQRQGNCGVSQKHALVLVNYGEATPHQLLSLANDIRKSVYIKFRIELIPEPRIF